METKNRQWEARLEELQEQGIEPLTKKDVPKKHCDHPNTMENSTATFFWIVAMVVGAIFKGHWAIWIFATLIWIKFITRHDK